MDVNKIVNDLSIGPLGDHIRGEQIEAILADLGSDLYDDERDWATDVAKWLRDNYA
jgi:hypothetical protein